MFYNSINSVNFKNRGYVGECKIETQKGTTISTAIIFILVIIAAFAVLNSNLFELYYYEGYGFVISCLLVFCSIIIFLFKRHFQIPKSSFDLLVYILIAELYCIVSAAHVAGGYRYMGAILNTMVVVTVITYSRLPQYVVKFTLFVLIVTALYSVITVGGYYEIQFTNDSVNSNYLAFFGVVILVYGNALLTYLRKIENRKLQLLRVLLAVTSFYIIWECQSRGSLLAWAFYILCVYVLPIKIFQSKRIVNLLSVAIPTVGVLFTYIYVKYLNLLMSNFMGKSTATRYRLWSYFWNNIFTDKSNALLGFGTRSELREIFGYGLHNIYIGIWYDVGFLGLIIFMGFIILAINRVYKNTRKVTMEQLYVIVGFLSFMISDFFAVTFTGPLVIWNYALLGLLSKRHIDGRKYKK